MQHIITLVLVVVQQIGRVLRNGPQILDTVLSEISLQFQAASLASLCSK